jgi:hypothetical protein
VHIVDGRFPMIGRPVDGFGDDGRRALGDAVGITMLNDSV